MYFSPAECLGTFVVFVMGTFWGRVIAICRYSTWIPLLY